MPARGRQREDTSMGTYQGRHRRRADPRELPAIFRGVADLITVIEDTQREDQT